MNVTDNPADVVKSSGKKYGTSVRKAFPAFSCILFLLIAQIAAMAYTIASRQINLTFVEQQLAVASETVRLRLARVVNSELALVLRMADSPVIRQYFIKPTDPELQAAAYAEFALYRQHFKSQMVFWISDANKLFHTPSESYILNPDDPASYWYNMTLYRTEKYNFNINYNPELKKILLWINAPVFVEMGEGFRKGGHAWHRH